MRRLHATRRDADTGAQCAREPPDRACGAVAQPTVTGHGSGVIRPTRRAQRGWNMMMPMPSSTTATPARSHDVGRTPSTAHSHISAVAT